MNTIIDRLLTSEEPSIRYKVRVNVLKEDPESRGIRKLQDEIIKSKRVQALLAVRNREGLLEPVRQEYKKWSGAHWVLVSLADLGYPRNDSLIEPIASQVTGCWLQPKGIAEKRFSTRPPRGKDTGVPIIQGRARRCASQQGNALYAAVTLGFNDEQTRCLAECLMRWQWPDGAPKDGFIKRPTPGAAAMIWPPGARPTPGG